MANKKPKVIMALNTVNLNVGYHNEHHDFPSVPWNKLPQIREAGGNFYNTLGHHTSYVRLLFNFYSIKTFLFFQEWLVAIEEKPS
jgi:fatty acid desaturase